MPATKNATTEKPATAKAKIAVTRQGIVESDKRSKTRTVVAATSKVHAKYGKILKRRTVLHVHDEQNLSAAGDLVEVAPCRPMSKTKSWTLVRVVSKGVGLKFEGVAAPGEEAEETDAKPAKNAKAKA